MRSNLDVAVQLSGAVAFVAEGALALPQSGLPFD